MNTNRFFELFGDYAFWSRGKVGREGFSVEDLYRQFKKRLDEEKNCELENAIENSKLYGIGAIQRDSNGDIKSIHPDTLYLKREEKKTS